MVKRILTHDWTLASLFTFGILLAGSDGDWFPWINFAGAAMLASIYFLTRLDRGYMRRTRPPRTGKVAAPHPASPEVPPRACEPGSLCHGNGKGLHRHKESPAC